MGILHLEIDDDLHTELKSLANRNPDCPDTLKEVVRSGLRDYRERHQGGDEGDEDRDQGGDEDV